MEATENTGPRNPTSVRDVLIHTTEGNWEEGDFEAHPPVGYEDDGTADLGDGVRIERLDHDEAELVMDACEPKGVGFRPTRQFGQRYAFVRDVALAAFREDPFAWDPGSLIYETVLLSRLIVDNSASTTYAARVVLFDNGDRQVIYAPRRESDHVYRLGHEGRDWLDRHEAGELRELIAAFHADRDGYPERLNSAIWLGEYARQTYWIDQAVPLTVTGLEVMISSGRRHKTRQFTQRVPRVAEAVEIADIATELCLEAYEDRSHGVHAGRIPIEGQDGRNAPLGRLISLRALLSAVERRCIEDVSFRARFVDDDTIAASWPLAN